MTSLVLILLLSQYPTGSITVRDEGTNLGKAIEVNCTGAGVTCTQSGWRWTLDITGGGGGGAPTTVPYWVGAADATLSAEHNLGALGTGMVLNTAGTPSIYTGTGAAPANQWLKSLDASGAGTWAQPAFTNISGTLPLSQMAPPADDTVMTGNGSVWEAKTLTNCTGTNDVMRYQAAGNTWGCSSTMATTGESFVTFGGSTTLTVDRVLTDGTSTVIDTATANQIKVNVVSPVASASALASDPTACGAGTYVSDISAAGVLTCGTPAGTYTLPALTSTVLGGVKGNGALTCSGTDKLSGFDAAGAMVCATDQTSTGGGSPANFAEVTVSFPATGSDMVSTVVTGQTWVTTSSKIVCEVTLLATSTRNEGDEDGSIENMHAAVHSRVAGTGFTLVVVPDTGDASGDYKFHCIGG